MKRFFTHLRDIGMAGLVFLLPVYVLFIVITKAWTSLSSVGTRLAGLFGMKSILGVGGSTVFSGLLMIALWILCGLLVRFSFVAAFNRAVEKLLSKYIPGYDTYRAMAEEKLHHKAKILPYTSALIKVQEYWQPAYVVEQDGDGNCVVFLPDTPNTHTGHVLLAKQDQVRLVSSVPADQLDGYLKKLGKGLLTERGIQDR
ncbi:MAG TPA: hypothetical protein VI455_18495 [Terriglobia bacterium]